MAGLCQILPIPVASRVESGMIFSVSKARELSGSFILGTSLVALAVCLATCLVLLHRVLFLLVDLTLLTLT